MAVYVGIADKDKHVSELSSEVQGLIMDGVDEALADEFLDDVAFAEKKEAAFRSRVCDLEDMVDVEYVDGSLSFYVVNNLRSMQDGTTFEVTRFDSLDKAVEAFNSFPPEYTSAIGGKISEMREIDLIHRKNGEPVQVNDFMYIDAWKDHPLVKQALRVLNEALGVQYESDVRLLGKTVLIPLRGEEDMKINSYFMDKYLQCEGKPYNILSSINEVFVEGKGWLAAQKFYRQMNALNEYETPERLKVTKFNVNYIDLNGRTGQSDVDAKDFVLLKQQTIERTAVRPPIDEQIRYADAVKQQQIEERKNKSKSKGKDKDRDYDDR